MNLKQRLNQPEVLLAPGVYDAFSALIAEQAGFEALYLSGASIAYTRLGRSDIGLATYSEVRDTLACITERVALPLAVTEKAAVPPTATLTEAGWLVIVGAVLVSLLLVLPLLYRWAHRRDTSAAQPALDSGPTPGFEMHR